MDFSKRSKTDVIGAIAALVMVFSLIFLDWFSLAETDPRSAGEDFICGVGQYTCTGWDTFPIMRWLLLAAATAPFILTYIIMRGHKLSWAPGEMTMVVGFAMLVLIGYNGIIDRPGSGTSEIGVGLDYGYWIALISTMAIAATGFLRSQAGQKRERKAPGTV
jgi:hypothetical protein